MTDFEEQRMIEQARAGDPKAKFEMSQWARQMSALEPDEERWNRLAAKCLVESAQAGYEPAKKMVQALIVGQDPGRIPAEEPVAAAEEEPVPAPEEPEEWMQDEAEVPVFEKEDPWQEEEGSEKTGFPLTEATVTERAFFDDEAQDGAEEDDDEPEGPARKILGSLQKAGAAAVAVVAGLFAKKEPGEARREPAEEPAQEYSRGRHSSEGPVVRWINDNWSLLRIVCIAVIVVMALLMVLLLTVPVKEPVPEPTPVPPPTPTMAPTPTPEPFPNAATRTEISTTVNLSYRPSEDEFLPASQSYTVDSDDGMNMRSGPGTDYDVLTRLASELRITAYASHQTGDEVWYLVNTGGEWGWVIRDYLK